MRKIRRHRVERLRELFTYEPNTGLLRRLTTRRAGFSCGTKFSTGHLHWWRVAIGHGRGKYYITHFHCFGKAVRHAAETRARLHQKFAHDGIKPIVEVA